MVKRRMPLSRERTSKVGILNLITLPTPLQVDHEHQNKLSPTISGPVEKMISLGSLIGRWEGGLPFVMFLCLSTIFYVFIGEEANNDGSHSSLRKETR